MSSPLVAVQPPTDLQHVQVQARGPMRATLMQVVHPARHLDARPQTSGHPSVTRPSNDSIPYAAVAPKPILDYVQPRGSQSRREAMEVERPAAHPSEPRKLSTSSRDDDSSALVPGLGLGGRRAETPVPLHPPLQGFAMTSSGHQGESHGRIQPKMRRFFSGGEASDSEYFSDSSVATQQRLTPTVRGWRPGRNHERSNTNARMGLERAATQEQQVLLDLPPAYTPD